MYHIYRIVAVLRDGSLTPFRSAFKKDVQLIERAWQLDEFIHAGQTGPLGYSNKREPVE